jgi:exonuclease VII large subunit
MKKMKTALEIAMEKADRIKDDATSGEEKLELIDRAKSILADFYRDRIDASGLWKKLKAENDPELYKEVQRILIDSIGIRNTPEQLKQRKEAILAVESLKEEQNTSLFEQALEQIGQLQKRYREEVEKIDQAQEEAVKNARMRMKPVRNSKGKTVMKLEPAIDEETQERIKKAYTDLENRVSAMINELLEELKEVIN